MDTNKCPKVIDQALGNDYNDCEKRSEVVAPADIMAAITEEQCQNLKNNTGIYGTATNNCEDFQGLLCDMQQDLEAVLRNESMVIFANDFSKCSDTDENPTLASMWSRIYRFAQAVSCVLCAYDPFMAVLLKSGRYPQILMGSPSQTMTGSELGCSKVGYPVWVSPDDIPTAGSTKPVTADGVYKAVAEAIMGVWHMWADHPEFQYYAEFESTGTNPLNSITGMANNDLALVKKNNANEINVIYKYTGGSWQKQEVLGIDKPENFAVTHILKGYWANKEIYYFKEGTEASWNLMDADLSGFEARLEAVEQSNDRVVASQANDNNRYVITTRATLAAANSVPATSGKVTLVFITG